jgi:Reverse transcriptase (RNA-dependent DNA polymerase)
VGVEVDVAGGIVWLRFHKQCLLVAACYFSPRNSRLYGTNAVVAEPVLALLDRLKAARAQGTKCIVVGDMNIRLPPELTDIPQVTMADAASEAPEAVRQAIVMDQLIYSHVPTARQTADTRAVASPWARQLTHGLQETRMVLLNGRAPGDEHGGCTYFAPPGRGRGTDGKSMVDLACVSAECYGYVQRFEVLPLDVGTSPDHCGLWLCMSLPHTPASAQQHKVRVLRPVGADQCQAYRRVVAATEGQFAVILDGMRTGAMTIHDAVGSIGDTLAAACKQACVRPGKVTCAAGAAWFDEECVPVRDAFRDAWASYTSLRQVVGEARLQNSLVHQQAVEARQAWSRLKRLKRRQWARQQQAQLIEGWFSGSQSEVWRALKAGKMQGCPLGDVAAWTQHFQGLFGQQPGDLQLTTDQLQLKEQLYAAYARGGGEVAQALHVDVTDIEVETAMLSMKTGKGRDAAGFTGELVKYVVVGVRARGPRPEEGVPYVPDVPEEGTVAPSLVSCIVHILNNLPAEYPPSMAISRLVPVAKSLGDLMDMGGYRGISVSAILSQIQDYILQHRATKYVEDNHMRAVVQCGFRQGHGTLDALFTMQHLISKAVFEKRPLYVCYVDFTKAFDMVRREEMLSRARQLGMGGRFLEVLDGWFRNTMLRVDVNGKCGEPFPTFRGTKQGSRLSPLCFGLFVEQLHELIQMQLPGAGPVVGSLRVPDIMYADDIKLMACTPSELQQLLDVLHLFCLLFDMKVNVSPQKTCIVLYGTAGVEQSKHPVVWKLGEQPVPVCETYRDLGIQCLATGKGHAARRKAAAGLAPGAEVLAQAGRRAMHGLLTMCKSHHLTQPDIKLRLFDILVEPVLSYGCQVWGPWVFHGRLDSPLCTPAEGVHTDFLRIMAGTGRRIKHQLLLWDYNRYPTMWHWVALATRFWGKLTAADARDKLSAIAMRADVQLMLSGCQHCWAFKFMDTLSCMGVVSREMWQPCAGRQLSVESVMSIKVKESAVTDALTGKWDAEMSQLRACQVDPRDPACAGDRIMAATYVAWVRAASVPPPHLKCKKLSFRQGQCLVRFRLGWHDLAIQTGRFSGVPRQQRKCVLCEALSLPR